MITRKEKVLQILYKRLSVVEDDLYHAKSGYTRAYGSISLEVLELYATEVRELKANITWLKDNT